MPTNGAILARIVDGRVELRFETAEGKHVTCAMLPDEFARFCAAMAALAEELWPGTDAPAAD